MSDGRSAGRRSPARPRARSARRRSPSPAQRQLGHQSDAQPLARVRQHQRHAGDVDRRQRPHARRGRGPRPAAAAPGCRAPRRSSGSRPSRAADRRRARPPSLGATQKKCWRQSWTSSGPAARCVLTIATSTRPSADQPRGLDRVRRRDLEAQRQRLGEQPPQHGQQQRFTQVVAGGDAQRGHAFGGQLRQQPLAATTPRRTGGSGCRAPLRPPG